jgi:hypothetical protein
MLSAVNRCKEHAMADLSRTESDSAISWAAVIAGAVAALALTLVLLSIGSAVGFSSVSPWPNSGVSATTFKITTGIYLVVMALITSTIAGYIAGRLRTKWRGIYNYEVQFRDTAHGFLAWGLATIVGAAALGGAATFFATGATTGAAVGAGNAAPQRANTTSDYYVVQLLRPSSAGGSAAPSQPGAAAASGGGSGQASRQAGLIFAHAGSNGGDLDRNDRAYLAQLVATQTGTSQADGEKRVDEVIAQAKAAADKARKAAAQLSMWLAISMLVGAFAASLAAIEGGQLRDRRWRGVIGTRAYTEARINK